MRKRDEIKKLVDEFNKWRDKLEGSPMKILFKGFDKILKKHLNEFSPTNQYLTTLEDIFEHFESYRDFCLKAEHERDKVLCERDEVREEWKRMKQESEKLSLELREKRKNSVELFNEITGLKDQLKAAKINVEVTDMIIEKKDAEIQKLREENKGLQAEVNERLELSRQDFNTITELKDQTGAQKEIDKEFTQALMEKDAEIRKLKDDFANAKGAIAYSLEIFDRVFESKGKHCS